MLTRSTFNKEDEGFFHYLESLALNVSEPVPRIVFNRTKDLAKATRSTKDHHDSITNNSLNISCLGASSILDSNIMTKCSGCADTANPSRQNVIDECAILTNREGVELRHAANTQTPPACNTFDSISSIDRVSTAGLEFGYVPACSRTTAPFQSKNLHYNE